MMTLRAVAQGFVLIAAGTAWAGPPEGLGVLGEGPDSAGPTDSRARVRVEVRPARTRVAPGDRLRVAVIFDQDRGWHIHPHEPEVPPELGSPDDYFATVIEVDAPQGSPLTAHPDFIQWPQVHEVEVGWLGEPVSYGVYDGRAVAFLPVTVAADAPPGPATLTLKPAYQACDEMQCMFPTPYPPRAAGEEPSPEWLAYGYPLRVEVVPLAEAESFEDSVAARDGLFAGFDESVWPLIASGAEYVRFDLFGLVAFDLNAGGTLGFVLLLLVAAVGGCLLNFTPCVLPVIPIKIMSLSHTAGNRGRTLLLGTAMSLGIIAFWMGLAVPIAAVTSFTATNQLFQYPAFTLTVGVVIAVLAVGMCGVFAMRLPQAVYQVSPSLESVPGSFLFGVMVAVLSTPCTAPFMGAAAAWATTQTTAIILTTFAAIGIGMALPYQVLSTFPRLVERMPRTGPASELIKQVMGLLMLAAAAYFVGVGVSGLLVEPPSPPGRGYWWFVAAFGVMAGGWLAWRTFRITPSPTRRAAFGGLGALILALSGFLGVRLTDKGPVDWVHYTPDRFERAKADGNVVVMEFTAEWCLNCKALEETVLRTRSVSEVLNGQGVVPMKVDLTGNNVEGNRMLAEVDRLTIPLLVIFSAGGEEVFKGDFYTAEQVLDGVARARTSVAGR